MMANRRRPIPTRPTPRNSRREIPSAATTLVFCLFMLALVAISLWWGLNHLLPSNEGVPDRIIRHDSLAPTYTYDGEIIRWYVFVDPDYGTQLIYNDHSWVPVPRIDSTGNQVGVSDVTDDIEY